MPRGPSDTLITPLALPYETALRAVAAMPGPALLDSGPGFGPAGRWCVLAACPVERFTSIEGVNTVKLIQADGSGEVERLTGHPLDALASWLARHGLDPAHDDQPPLDHEPPFRGGAIGFISYDLAPALERLPRRHPRPPDAPPEIAFGLYRDFVTYDRIHDTLSLHLCNQAGPNLSGPSKRRDFWMDRLISRSVEPARAATRTELGPIVSNFSREAYMEAVEKGLEYVRAGDIFQVNLSQRFEAMGSVDPIALYLRLRSISPAPFGAYLDAGDATILSASPEWFWQTRGDRIITRPIKGTRPRGATPEEDRRQLEALAASAKDRAELTMIIDLERNDLGRVCEYGSVRVVDPYAIETFAQVHHQVATVEGRLRPGCGAAEVVRAMFPGGSITGAPKVRAMEIIDELERCRRGVYTGAIGHFSHGASGFNIPIRTIVATSRGVSYQVGGGIVADSVPAAEYEETLHKARGLRLAIEGGPLS
jgi:para-aminobenzoate synthetase component 1